STRMRLFKKLVIYSTVGGIVLGLILAFLADLRLLTAAGITFNKTTDIFITGLVCGTGSAVIHDIVKGLYEGKQTLSKLASPES
ncbi:MAG TPA: hypothetical protein VLA72_22305, partial [Anaerolineales bacterium]|nr:hypothetical protein [Anaerolineales bacterium]